MKLLENCLEELKGLVGLANVRIWIHPKKAKGARKGRTAVPVVIVGIENNHAMVISRTDCNRKSFKRESISIKTRVSKAQVGSLVLYY